MTIFTDNLYKSCNDLSIEYVQQFAHKKCTNILNCLPSKSDDKIFVFNTRFRIYSFIFKTFFSSDMLGFFLTQFGLIKMPLPSLF